MLHIIQPFFLFPWRNSPYWITFRRTTVGRTPLDEWSARRRDLYLTTHSNHNRQTSMSPGGNRSKQERSCRHTLYTSRPLISTCINSFNRQNFGSEHNRNFRTRLHFLPKICRLLLRSRLWPLNRSLGSVMTSDLHTSTEGIQIWVTFITGFPCSNIE